VLGTSRNDHDVALAADPLFAAEAEFHLALEHPHDLLIGVTVRLDMDAGSDAPPYDHPLITGENAAADLFADLLLNQGGKRAEAHQCRHNFLPHRMKQAFFTMHRGGIYKHLPVKDHVVRQCYQPASAVRARHSDCPSTRSTGQMLAALPPTEPTHGVK
jgi:hypothetical protein